MDDSHALAKAEAEPASMEPVASVSPDTRLSTSVPAQTEAELWGEIDAAELTSDQIDAIAAHLKATGQASK